MKRSLINSSTDSRLKPEAAPCLRLLPPSLVYVLTKAVDGMAAVSADETTILFKTK